MSCRSQPRGTPPAREGRLGGPGRHLRVCILDLITGVPDDAARYFDYVLGFTDKATVLEVLRDCSPHHAGVRLAAKKQPSCLPGVKQRWKFIEPTIAKTPIIKLIPMISSLGCPYTCSFCI